MQQKINRWLYKMEYKYGKYAISNLMAYVTSTMLVVYLFSMFTNVNVNYYVALISDLVLRGEVWRLVTFIFTPPSTSSPIFLFISLYFYYMIGSVLEQHWGKMKFNIYYLLGMLGVIIGSFISGYGDSSFLNTSLFLVFAHLFPDTQFMLFFMVPIKAKYMGYISWALLILQFIFAPIPQKLSILFSLLNFFIFFGKDFFNKIKQEIVYYNRRKKYKRSVQDNNRR